MAPENIYQAVVEKIIPYGRHGPYAVGRNKKLGSVTFSLKPPVWEEEDLPEPGTHVVLSRLMKKNSGWRAKRGRFVTPSDEQQL